MDKPTVALLCNGYGFVNRGAERFTEEFYTYCSDLFDITIFGIKPTDHSIGLYTRSRDNFKIPWRNGKAYLESFYFGKKWFKQNQNKAKYDVIFNNSGFPCSYWCDQYRKKTKIPFITRARGGGNEEKISRFFKPDAMVFLSEFHRKKIYDKTIKTTVIPNAIDINKYKKNKKHLKYLDELEKPLFLSTSALVKYKRNDLCIKSVAKLKNGTLIQTSDGNLKYKTLQLAKNLLNDRYLYLGVISREELIDLYKSCDVFINASKKEAFGVVFLEALASGLPVVTQSDERRKEIIGDAGYIIECKDINKFSIALKNACENDLKNTAVKQAMKYDWGIIKKQYKKIIDDVITN